MTPRDAVDEILKRTHSLTQKRVAEAAGVNRGQLSAWLAADGPLSEERQGMVVRALLGLLVEASQEDGRDYRRELADYVAFLESSEAGRSLEPVDTQIVDRPVSPREPTYIERDEDRRLLSMLDAEPLRMAIVGGPKLGKSSLLLRAEAELKRKVRHRPPILVVRVDFTRYLREPADTREPLLPWFAHRCEEQIGVTSGSRLLAPEDFPEWLKRNVMAASRSGWAAVLLGGIDRLFDDMVARIRASSKSGKFRPPRPDTGSEQRDHPVDLLLTMLSYHWDETVGDREYERCKFILAFDRHHDALMNHVSAHQSSGLRALTQAVVTGRLPENLVERLCERLGLRGDLLQATATDAWHDFQGHPFLTRALVRDRLDGSGTQAVNHARQALLRSIELHWPDSVHDFVTSALVKDGRVEGRTSRDRSMLEESGLFSIVRSTASKRFMEPLSDWVVEGLKAGSKAGEKA